MKERILIIEDETAIQSILAELLTDAGYSIEVAGDGLEGVTKFREKSFSLVLLDIMMPKIDGYTVCEMIRQGSNAPIIMLTALDEEEAQVKAFELKVDDYITNKRTGRRRSHDHTILWEYPVESGKLLGFCWRKAYFPHPYRIRASGTVHAPSGPGIYTGQSA